MICHDGHKIVDGHEIVCRDRRQGARDSEICHEGEGVGARDAAEMAAEQGHACTACQADLSARARAHADLKVIACPVHTGEF